ncbi:MAG TPA: hypothetical protein V6D47_10755 [Oscillatoriaceae cyanobacterium]
MSGDDKKRDFFGQLKHLVDRAVGVPEPAPKAPPSPAAKPSVARPPMAKPPLPKTAPMAPREPSTNALPPKAVGTDQLQRTAPSTANLDVMALDIPDEAELSPRRLAMISDFITGKAKMETMRDPKYMYMVVSEERSYQTQLLKELKLRREAAEDPVAIADLDTRIAGAQAIIKNLFKVLKHLTGKAGKTGGTDFLGDEQGEPSASPLDLS